MSSSGTSFYPANGAVPVVLSRGTAVPVLLHGVQVSEAHRTGSMVRITVVAPPRLPLLTRRVYLRRLHLKDKAVVRAFGQVWQRAV